MNGERNFSGTNDYLYYIKLQDKALKKHQISWLQLNVLNDRSSGKYHQVSQSSAHWRFLFMMAGIEILRDCPSKVLH